MAKLTKKAAAQHQQAAELAALDRGLDEDEKAFVLDHWQASSSPSATLDGAFFTPRGLARDLSIEVNGHGARVLDLGAGIGHLAASCRNMFGRFWNNEPARELVCIDRNPDYVAVGRKVLPEATWICADLFDLPDLGEFDVVLSNPPYGTTQRSGTGPRYQGRQFEYHVIDIAGRLGRYGVFLIPQQSAPFTYSGQRCFTESAGAEYERFTTATGIHLEAGCGVDTSIYREQWQGVQPHTEVVTADFTEPAGTSADVVDVLAQAAS